MTAVLKGLSTLTPRMAGL